MARHRGEDGGVFMSPRHERIVIPAHTCMSFTTYTRWFNNHSQISFLIWQDSTVSLHATMNKNRKWCKLEKLQSNVMQCMIYQKDKMLTYFLFLFDFALFVLLFGYKPGHLYWGVFSKLSLSRRLKRAKELLSSFSRHFQLLIIQLLQSPTRKLVIRNALSMTHNCQVLIIKLQGTCENMQRKSYFINKLWKRRGPPWKSGSKTLFITPNSLFSCPQQLNRWPCHSLTDWLTFTFDITEWP